ncbi:MAG TPA: ferredoxin [Deltaproteobacteria bacterium]|nr:ferredoxin [Deltaproteobacteria bacterium]HCP44844.1 ferredoxin [Deltaproteobacteria bacterium]
MSRFERHVFVCINERDESDARGCCVASGSLDVHRWFKSEFKSRNWKGRMRANKAGCLDVCEFGPAVVVYPEGVWYSPRSEQEVKEICDRHLAGGEVVTELLIPGLG